MGFVLTALNKLNSVRQELGTIFLLYMTWTDPRLSWDPTVAGNPKTIVFYVNEIWTPPLVISNAIDDSMFLLRDDTFPMIVSYNGTATWIPRLSPTTTCEIDTSYFPVDTQVCDWIFYSLDCNISITSWVHSTDELLLVTESRLKYPKLVNEDFYTADKSWTLTNPSVQIVNQTGIYEKKYNSFNYRFIFQRDKRFYWAILVIPGICLSVLQPLVFLIPLNAQGTRLSYATGMLLSFLFYTGLLNGILPPVFGAERGHVFGESFSNVMIGGTVAAVLVILEMIVTNMVEKSHPKGEKGTGVWCLVGNGWKECKKCVTLQVFNGVVFLIFAIVYIVGITLFLIDLEKEEAAAVNFQEYMMKDCGVPFGNEPLNDFS